MLDERQVNSEGVEKTLATNTLSTFLMTNLLIPTLSKSSDPRVIIISSGGMLTEKLQVK
jgi:dehydrogenase/reductase SDR family protein 12